MYLKVEEADNGMDNDEDDSEGDGDGVRVDEAASGDAGFRRRDGR